MTESPSYAYSESYADVSERLSYGENHPERRSFFEQLQRIAEKGCDLKRLHEVVDFVEEDVNPSKQHPEEYFKFLGLEDIEENTGRAAFRTILGREILSKSNRMYRGNIVFSGLRPYLNKVHLVEVEEAIGSAELFVVQPRTEIVIPEFLLRYLLSNLTVTQTKWILTGSSYPRLDIEDFKQLRILVPRIPEQGGVLNGLRDIDNEVAHVEERVKKIRHTSDQLVLDNFRMIVGDEEQEYFFRTGKDQRSPYFAVMPNVSTDRLNYLFHDPRLRLLEDFAQAHATTELGKIVSVPIVRGIQPDYVEDGRVMVIKTVDLKDSYVDYSHCLRASEACFQKYPHARAQENDILISSTGIISLGRVDIFDTEKPAIVDGHISIVRLPKNYNPQFIAYFLRTQLGKLQFEKWWTGSSGQIEVEPIDLSKFIIPDNSEKGVPLYKQEEIAKQVTEIMRQAIQLERTKKQFPLNMNRKFSELLGVDTAPQIF